MIFNRRARLSRLPVGLKGVTELPNVVGDAGEMVMMQQGMAADFSKPGRDTHYSAASSSGASRGTIIRILVPSPGLVSKSIRPPKRLVTML
jgi:hypothetical protein